MLGMSDVDVADVCSRKFWDVCFQNMDSNIDMGMLPMSNPMYILIPNSYSVVPGKAL